MANNIELLNREDAKDAKEEPPHPQGQFHYQKNQDFVGVVPRAHPSPATRSIGIAAIGHGHGGTAPTYEK